MSDGILIPENPSTQDYVIKAYLDARKPLLLNGDPGLGKTSYVRALAKRNGLHVEILIGSRNDPIGILTGMPVPIHEDANGVKFSRVRTVNSAVEWFDRVIDIAAGKPDMSGRTFEGVIIFLDELRSMPEDVQASMLSFIQDRELDGVKLPDNVYFLAASNNTLTGAANVPLAAAMANRWGHWDFDMPVDEFLHQLPQNFGAPMTPELAVELARLTAYLRNNQAGTGIVSSAVPADPDKADGAWPSRRSWHEMTPILAVAGSNRAARDGIILSKVGEDAALAFKQWDETLNLPSFDEVINGYDRIDWGSFTTDKVYAIIVMATNMATGENIVKVANMLVKVGDFHEALAALQGRELLTRARKVGLSQDAAMELAKILSNRFRDILSDASGVPTPRRA